MAKDLKITSTGGISAAGGLSATGDNNYFACKVGIGTATPDVLLDIRGGNEQHLYIEGGNDSVIALARIKTIAGGSVLTLETGTTSDSRDILKAKNSSGTVLNLQADGKLGIGIETPTEVLTVAGNISAQGSIYGSFVSTGDTINGDLTVHGSISADAYCSGGRFL